MNNGSNLKDSIYNAILEDILSHEYKANDILNEKNLVEKFGCSKTPVREALQTLCNDNVLRNIPRYGYEVVRLTSEDVTDMLQFRYVLEGGLLTANYQKFTKSQIDKLEQIDILCKAPNIDVWTHWAHNSEFHLKMVAFCNNLYATNELKKCMDRLKRAYAQSTWNKPEDAPRPLGIRNHDKIIQALRHKDLESLLSYLKEDLNGFEFSHMRVD